MNDQGVDHGQGVLRRLLQARERTEVGSGKAPQLPHLSPPTPARAAATAVGRAADRLYKLPVQPISVTPGGLTLAELPELLPEGGLLAVLQGPGEALGVMALSFEAVTALIEIQTLGRITGRQTERRKLTRADAMICADFVNRVMADLATEMAALDGFEGFAGYRYATYLDDPRPLALMLEDKTYRSLDFRLRLGGGETRDAAILLALPQPVVPQQSVPQGPALLAAPDPADLDKARGSRAATPSSAPGETLYEAVQAAPVELLGILCRRRITLGELRSLVPGKMLSLPRVTLNEARIETPDGQLLACGKFGEADGCHAVRLHDPLVKASVAPTSAPPQRADEAGWRTAPAAIVTPVIPEPPIADLVVPDPFRAASGMTGAGDAGSGHDHIVEPKAANHG